MCVCAAKDHNQVLTIMQKCFPAYFESQRSSVISTTSRGSSMAKAFNKTELDARRLQERLYYRNPEFFRSLQASSREASPAQEEPSSPVSPAGTDTTNTARDG